MPKLLDDITRRFLSPKEQREIENEIPRYIDGNLLLLNFAKRRNDQKGIYISLVEAEHLIRNAPTVEAEQKHGYWERDCDSDISCSVCNHYAYSQAIREASHSKQIPIIQELLPRCPHCGAKMDEEVPS